MGWSKTARSSSGGWGNQRRRELTLDFTAGSYLASGATYATIPSYLADDPATFARSLSAYEVVSGALVSQSSNVARVGNGLLIEPAATNLLLQSQTLDNAIWVNNGSTRTANAVAAPDGTMTAEQFVGTLNYHGVYGGGSAAYVAGTSYTLSAFWKPISGTATGSIGLGGAAFNSGSGDRQLLLNTSNGSLANFSEATGSGIQALANGWYRAWVTFTATASALSDIILYYGPDSGSKTWAFWGIQLEVGPLTSYIPTTTAAVTRPADALVLDLPAGTTQLFVTKADNTVQLITGLSAGAYSFPTNMGQAVRAISNAGPVVAAVAAKAASSIGERTGINTHYPWNGTIYDTLGSTVTSRITEAGFRIVRDRHDFITSNQSAQVAALAAANVKFVVLTEAGDVYSTVKTRLDSWPAAALLAIEGYNEPTNASAAASFQASLYDGLRGDTDFDGAAIIAPSVVSETVANSIGGGSSSKMDAINIHPYAYGERPEPQDNAYSSYSWHAGIQDQFKPGAPVWITEAGYHNYVPEAGMPGISEAAAAIYGPRSIAWFLTHPTWDIRAYIRYEILDNTAQPAGLEQHFGLLYSDGSRKPEFYTTKALLTNLADTGGSAGVVKAALSGANPRVVMRPLRRSDGKADLLVWNAADVWSTTTDTDTSVSNVSETITLGDAWSSAQSLNVADGASATFASATITSARQITLNIGPNVTIIRLTP